jgi:ABC-type Fe3+-siderophore transport system permease subunit
VKYVAAVIAILMASALLALTRTSGLDPYTMMMAGYAIGALQGGLTVMAMVALE